MVVILLTGGGKGNPGEKDMPSMRMMKRTTTRKMDGKTSTMRMKSTARPSMTMKPARSLMVKPSTTKMMLPQMPVYPKKINISRWKNMMKLSLLTLMPDVGSMRSSSVEAFFQSLRCPTRRLATWLLVLAPHHLLRQRGHPVGTRVRKEKGVVERITSRVHQDLLEKARSRPAVRLELAPTTACDVERGHRAAECPVNRSPNKRPAPSPNKGLVIFQDASGHERPDSAMLDPGASAYLSGYGPFKRYVEHLRSLGFPLERLEFARCYRKFHFGGDASWCRWMCKVPAFLDGGYGTIQCYLIPGETPMLIGRPIMEALKISLDFSARAIKFGTSAWQEATIGLHGEYLLPLTADFDLQLLTQPPLFEYVVPADEQHGDARLDLERFDLEEKVFYQQDDKDRLEDQDKDDGNRPLKRHQLRTCEIGLSTAANSLHSYITAELHAEEQPQRVLWEVYCGGGRTSSIAETLGMSTEQFDLSTGWDFSLLEHQELFKERLRLEAPHEVLLAPTCGPWSQMQNLAAQTPEQQVHLKFCKEVYLQQLTGD